VDQLKRIFAKLSIAQRIWIVAAVVGVFGGLSAISHWNQERDFKPLFTGVVAEDAGPLLAKLKESNVEYRLADNGTTVLVPSARVAELRIEMASAGLPKSGRIGFELFDKANFGASEFAEQVNYHRAIEGELERSVMSIREVEAARVHITLAKDSLYSEQREAAKASVLVKLRHTAALSPQNVAAICQLTASAVPGLAPEQVSLVDTNGNLLNRPRPNNSGDGAQETEASLDYRKSVERDLQNKIAATLDPLLGAEHFRAGVSADVDLTSGEQSEEIFDPTKSVMTTSQRTDDGPALPFASGIPGSASNLPKPVTKPLTGSSNYARHTESVGYQTSRVVKHTRLPQGAVKKLSLSVLVDHTLRWDKTNRIIEPPSAEKLKVIHDLVAAATGLDTVRGDQLVVEAFPFESTLNAEPETIAPLAEPPSQVPMPPWLKKLSGKTSFVLIGIGAGALVALMAALIILRKKSKAKRTAVELTEKAAIESLKHTPAGAQKALEAQMEDNASEQARLEAEALVSLKLPVKTKKTEVLIKHIATEMKKDPKALAHVVRSWLNG
jgi:flagellar M-ring protein FliF